MSDKRDAGQVFSFYFRQHIRVPQPNFCMCLFASITSGPTHANGLEGLLEDRSELDLSSITDLFVCQQIAELVCVLFFDCQDFLKDSSGGRISATDEVDHLAV